ncbi:dihydrolipoamide acetyltransferase family protein [Actinocorallia longicatena]|uniref:Dihydrolipoamide acetyltransferase component of pyruvate dehydrogenase complex n=1 Tax=Actinocorallia longicatena TaxID=111803 RepID=A0ABP6QH18_9ACTN
MVKHFRLPDVGEGLTEADIVKWHVAVGDTVEINQTIVEIETAKAIVELPCPFEGVVTEILVAEGDTVDVGTPIIGVAEEGAEPVAEYPAPGAPVEELAPSPAADPGTHIAPTTGPDVPEEPGGGAAKRTPVLVGYGVKPGATKRRARKDSTRPVTAVPASTRPAVSGGQAPVKQAPVRQAPERRGAQALAKPPVRKLARDLGVDLAAVTGTGPAGSITREDVRAFAVPVVPGSPAATAPGVPVTVAVTVAAPGERETRIPVKGVRKATAGAMVASAFSAPHVTEFLQVDVTATMKAVERLRAYPEFEGLKVSPLVLVARALLLAVRRHPMINASWADQEIVQKNYVNLGIAVAAPRGLIVPNIKDAQDLTLPGLAEGIATLARTAREGRSTPQDLSQGTITITNVGVFGIDAGTPILTPGEVAILAFGQIRDLPWVHKGKVRPRKVTTLSLSFDHRVVDGELGSAVLRDVGAMLQDPLRML